MRAGPGRALFAPLAVDQEPYLRVMPAASGVTYVMAPDSVVETIIAHPGSATTSAMSFRRVDNNNGMRLTATLTVGSGDVVLQDVIAGAVVTRGSAAGVLVPGRRQVLRIRMERNRYWVSLDGVQLFFYEDLSSLYITATTLRWQSALLAGLVPEMSIYKSPLTVHEALP